MDKEVVYADSAVGGVEWGPHIRIVVPHFRNILPSPETVIAAITGEDIACISGGGGTVGGGMVCGGCLAAATGAAGVIAIACASSCGTTEQWNATRG